VSLTVLFHEAGVKLEIVEGNVIYIASLD